MVWHNKFSLFHHDILSVSWLLWEHQTLDFSGCCNFSILTEPLNIFMSCALDDSTYQKLSGDPEHIIQWFWPLFVIIPHWLRPSSRYCAHIYWCIAVTWYAVSSS
jgi:hypothetical protein